MAQGTLSRTQFSEDKVPSDLIVYEERGEAIYQSSLGTQGHRPALAFSILVHFNFSRSHGTVRDLDFYLSSTIFSIQLPSYRSWLGFRWLVQISHCDCITRCSSPNDRDTKRQHFPAKGSQLSQESHQYLPLCFLLRI